MIPVSNYTKDTRAKTRITQTLKIKASYQAIEDYFLLQHRKTRKTFWHYSKCSLIPNQVKFPESSERELCVLFCQEIIKNKAQDIFPIQWNQMDTQHMLIHAVSAPLILLIAGTSQPTELPRFNTLEIKDGEGRERTLQILTNQKGVIIAVEFLKKDKDLPLGKKVSKDWIYNINQSDLKEHKSFTRKRINKLEDEQEKLLFIAASYVTIRPENENALVSLSIENYSGKLLINSIITPRGSVKHYQSHTHGLKELDIIGRWDEHEAKVQLFGLLEGKILVGCNMYDFIKAVSFPSQRLLGIRDISNGKCFQDMGLNRAHGAYRTDFLFKRFVSQTSLPKSDLKSEIEVRKSRLIYQAVEMKWEDHVLPILEEVKPRVVIPSVKPFINQSLNTQPTTSEESLKPFRQISSQILSVVKEVFSPKRKVTEVDTMTNDELGLPPNVTIEDEEMEETFFQPPEKLQKTEIKAEPTIQRSENNNITILPYAKFFDLDMPSPIKVPNFAKDWVPPIIRYEGVQINEVIRMQKNPSGQIPIQMDLAKKKLDLLSAVYKDPESGELKLICYY